MTAIPKSIYCHCKPIGLRVHQKDETHGSDLLGLNRRESDETNPVRTLRKEAPTGTGAYVEVYG
ncbi:hypothetical protein PT2222_40292 [Paraburkholderia tropica]